MAMNPELLEMNRLQKSFEKLSPQARSYFVAWANDNIENLQTAERPTIPNEPKTKSNGLDNHTAQ
jgi:hypothetical protein